jgi:hypothetical protein
MAGQSLQQEQARSNSETTLSQQVARGLPEGITQNDLKDRNVLQKTLTTIVKVYDQLSGNDRWSQDLSITERMAGMAKAFMENINEQVARKQQEAREEDKRKQEELAREKAKYNQDPAAYKEQPTIVAGDVREAERISHLDTARATYQSPSGAALEAASENRGRGQGSGIVGSLSDTTAARDRVRSFNFSEMDEHQIKQVLAEGGINSIPHTVMAAINEHIEEKRLERERQQQQREKSSDTARTRVNAGSIKLT